MLFKLELIGGNIFDEIKNMTTQVVGKGQTLRSGKPKYFARMKSM